MERNQILEIHNKSKTLLDDVEKMKDMLETESAKALRNNLYTGLKHIFTTTQDYLNNNEGGAKLRKRRKSIKRRKSTKKRKSRRR